MKMIFLWEIHNQTLMGHIKTTRVIYSNQVYNQAKSLVPMTSDQEWIASSRPKIPIKFSHLPNLELKEMHKNQLRSHKVRMTSERANRTVLGLRVPWIKRLNQISWVRIWKRVPKPKSKRRKKWQMSWISQKQHYQVR